MSIWMVIHFVTAQWHYVSRNQAGKHNLLFRQPLQQEILAALYIFEIDLTMHRSVIQLLISLYAGSLSIFMKQLKTHLFRHYT